MTSTYLDCLFPPAIVRRFSTGLTVLLLAACGQPQSEATNADTTLDLRSATAPANPTALSVSVSVDLSTIADAVSDTATVFVFVREPGQRMPLGVEQYTVSTLPEVITFVTDQSYSQVEVVARVSRSGKVARAPDDHEAIVTTRFAHSTKPVTLGFSDSQVQTASGSTAIQDVAQVDTAHVNSVSIRIDTDLPPEVAAKFSKQTTVFIVANRPDQAMPLAVKKTTFGALPATVSLSDQDAMLPGRGLSSAQSFIVSARISKSGNASRETGDWIGLAKDSDRQADGDINITIDQPVD